MGQPPTGLQANTRAQRKHTFACFCLDASVKQSKNVVAGRRHCCVNVHVNASWMWISVSVHECVHVCVRVCPDTPEDTTGHTLGHSLGHTCFGARGKWSASLRRSPVPVAAMVTRR